MTPQEARDASHAFLKEREIQYNSTLPVIESRDELHPPDAQSVARRAMSICHVIGIGFGGRASELLGAVRDFGLEDSLSAVERDLLSRDSHTDQEKVDTTWLVECMQSFGWSLGLCDLDPLSECDELLASYFPAPFSDPSEFIASSQLRPFDEIYAQADLHYRLHWVARQARLTGSESAVSESLIRERRRALDWVIGVESDWDEVPSDT